MVYRRYIYKKDEPTYHVYLYRKEVKILQRASNDKDFFNNSDNILPFTAAQKAELKRVLLHKRYSITQERDSVTFFKFKSDGVAAVLTDFVLYFVSTWDDNDMFEIRMTASEFTEDDFEKYDPQNGGWEEIEY